MARSHAVIAAQVKGGDALSTARVGGEDGRGEGGVRYLEKEARSKGRTHQRPVAAPLLSNALKPRTVAAAEYYGAGISAFCDLKANLPPRPSSVESRQGVAF